MKRRLAFAALALSLAWACGDDEKPPPPITPQPDAGEGGNGGSGAAGSGNGGTGKGGDGGAAGEGGAGTSAGGTAGSGAVGGSGPTGGTAGAGGEGGEDDGVPSCPSDLADPPSSGTFSCDPAIEWGPATDVAIGGNAARLVAVTPDELTMAWLAISFIGNTYGVADRATASDPFGAGQELMVTNLVALSPDGLRLVGLSEDRSQFYELTRTARGEMFGAPDAGAFTTLNTDAAANDLTFSTAVIAPNDTTLYYAVRGSADGEHPVRVSSRSGAGPWPVGTPLEVCELTTVGSGAREPTGISADGRTLFYFDQARGRERASWRETPSGPFVWSTDLGDRNLAQPNTGCSRLYFTLVTGPSFSDPI